MLLPLPLLCGESKQRACIVLGIMEIRESKHANGVMIPSTNFASSHAAICYSNTIKSATLRGCTRDRRCRRGKGPHVRLIRLPT